MYHETLLDKILPFYIRAYCALPCKLIIRPCYVSTWFLQFYALVQPIWCFDLLEKKGITIEMDISLEILLLMTLWFYVEAYCALRN